MSCTVSTFLVSIDTIRKQIGKPNSKLAKAVKRKYDIDEYPELGELLTGAELTPDRDAMYADAFERICGIVGEEIDVPEFDSVHFFPFEDVAPWMAGGPPIEFPYKGEILVGYRELPQIKEDLASWPDDDKLENLKRDVFEYLEALRELFELAVKKKKDVVTFYC